MPNLVFLDTETTGLDPTRHVLWNVGMVVRYPEGDETEFEWMWWPDLSTADPGALKVNRFYDRASDRLVSPWAADFDGSVHCWENDVETFASPARVAHDIAHTLDGSTIIGAVPSFDVNFLTPWLHSHGHVFTGHYHLLDIEALAVGYLAGWWAQAKSSGFPVDVPVNPKPPWKSTDLSLAVGVDPGDFERHTALGDAKWVAAIYEKVMGR